MTQNIQPNENLRKIYCAIGKSDSTGKYNAILSDTSIDRDNEFMGPELLQKWATDPNRYLPMLIDHKNEIKSLIGNWVNPQLIQKDENHALVLEPVFFKSNPNSEMVTGLLEEGAKLGLSIGAIPKKSVTVKRNGMEVTKWTDAELLETSFVAIPSNRNSYITLAKSFNLEGDSMKKENENSEVKDAATEETDKPVEESKEEETTETVEETQEETTEKAVKTKEEKKVEVPATKKAEEMRKSDLTAMSEQNTGTDVMPETEDIFKAYAYARGFKQ